MACGDVLRELLTHGLTILAPSVSWDDYRRAAAPYLAATEAAFPWVVEELRGAAQGAGLDFLDLFTCSIEELFGPPPAPLLGRCADFAVCPPTTDGHTLLAHNNDLSPATQPLLVAVEWLLPDHPRLFTVGVGGIFLSIGINAARLALTGNELSPNDERPGIPRLLIARALLSARTFDEAVAIALHPRRASSYNNLVSTGEGRIASVEASATNHALLLPEDGWLVHTNHYTHPRMEQYERDPRNIAKSVSRYDRARELMLTRSGPATLPMLQTFLADHNSTPASICRHDDNVRTVFSALIDLTEGTVDAALGNPCVSEFQRVWAV